MNIIKSYNQFESDDKKKKVISIVISELEKIDDFPVNKDKLQSLSKNLNKVGIKPIDIEAAIETDDADKQKQYLIEGPSAPGGGGNGALKDLKNMLNKL